jgi:hypothetical protein
VVLRGGLVTYTVETKITLAGVPRELLGEVGPVAAPTAQHHTGSGHAGQRGRQQTGGQRFGGGDGLAAGGQRRDEGASFVVDERVVNRQAAHGNS